MLCIGAAAFLPLRAAAFSSMHTEYSRAHSAIWLPRVLTHVPRLLIPLGSHAAPLRRELSPMSSPKRSPKRSPLKSGLIWPWVEKKHTRAFLKAARSLQECVEEWYQVDSKGSENMAGLSDLTELAAAAAASAAAAAPADGALRSSTSALGVLELFDGFDAALEERAHAKVDAAWSTAGAVERLLVEVLDAMEEALADMQGLHDSGVLFAPSRAAAKAEADDLDCPVQPSDAMEWSQDIVFAFRAERVRKAALSAQLRPRLGDIDATKRAAAEWGTRSASSAVGPRGDVDLVFAKILGT